MSPGDDAVLALVSVGVFSTSSIISRDYDKISYKDYLILIRCGVGWVDISQNPHLVLEERNE